MRKWLGVLSATILVVALGAPLALLAANPQLEERIAALEERVDALEALHDSTTLPPSTSTTTTTVATTTTTAPTTTTTAPVTTTTTTAGQEVDLSSDLIISQDETRSGSINGNGHAIIIDGADVVWTDLTVTNVERIMWVGACGVANLSNVAVVDSGVSGVEGAYPIHFHLCGDSTRGSTLTDVTVTNGQNHAFVPHGSNGITFTRTVAKDTVGIAYWWDPPGTNETDCSPHKFCTLDNSNDITYDSIVVDGVVPNPGERGIRNAGVYLGAGSGNAIINSTVIGVQGEVDCSAYHWPEHANQNVGGNVWVFENNFGTSVCHGIFVWQNDGNHHIVDGFTGGGLDHGAYGNDYDYRNIDVPYTEVHAAGWVMSDSHAGDVILRPHRFAGTVEWTNVTMDSLTVDDDASDPNNGINFIVTGTNLTCADVNFLDPHPDTTVTLNGEGC